MEVAFVFVSDGDGYFLNRESSIFEQKCRLGKALFLQMLGVGLACSVLYLVAEPEEIVMQYLCCIGEAAIAVILLNITENIHNSPILTALVR